MIALTPARVTINAVELRDVASITIDRRAEQPAVEYSDLGPHVAFVDAPRQRIIVTIVRAVTVDETVSPVPGDSVTLSFQAAPSAAAPRPVLVAVSAVVISVQHDADHRRGMQQTITLLAVSPDGVADPVTTTPVIGS